MRVKRPNGQKAKMEKYCTKVWAWKEKKDGFIEMRKILN